MFSFGIQFTNQSHYVFRWKYQCMNEQPREILLRVVFRKYITLTRTRSYLIGININVNTFHNKFFQDSYFCAIYEVSLRPKLAWFFTKYVECILCFILCL